METFAWFESTALSIWARESQWVFFGALTLHSLTMGLVVGINIFINCRLLGFVRTLPLARLTGFDRLLVIALIGVLISGAALLLAYPAKALTNPVFYFKLGCIVTALGIYARVFRPALLIYSSADPDEVRPIPNVKGLAGSCLTLWVSSIFAGRFLAYTNSVLLASDYF